MTIYRVNAPILNLPPIPPGGPIFPLESIPGIGQALINRHTKDITPIGRPQEGKTYPFHIEILEQEQDDYFIRIPKKEFDKMKALVNDMRKLLER